MADLPFLKSHKNQKKCLIPLDKSPNLWYNTSVPREQKQFWVVTYHEKECDNYGKQEDCGADVRGTAGYPHPDR